MITINIDGKDCTTVNGLTIIDAARSNGIDIPALGYDPRVTPPSNVEAAFVEMNDGIKTRFVSATSTPVVDGMIIRTQSEALQSYRRIYLQALLRHHTVTVSRPVFPAARRISIFRSTFTMSTAVIFSKRLP